jgi:class 3 adenylate cyclase/tetratricopeptide (TPR) repeat protein
MPPPALEERKIVSVLFCDLVGFTAASEQQDPEDVRARIRPYHARLRHEIERYGGTVEKFVGDAVMAVYGAPVAHEDDAERAVRAGLAILDAIGELNDADPDLRLQVRVGVNTGEAVVALDARPERGEGIVTGDVVNTAARIEGIAPVNAVAVGEQSYRATKRAFEYEALPPAIVKGKAEPLEVWRAVAARARFGSDVGRGFTTPFVGRDLEKALLVGIFERAVQQRSVQLVTVVGEPGIGKSRLIAELRNVVDARPELIRWRQGRCLPYGEGITFWALGEIVKAEAGILESDPPDVAAAKLEETVAGIDDERDWVLQRLTPLVGIEVSAPAERQELFTAWRRYCEYLAAGRPTVLVFDDLHWADDALLAFLEHLAEWSQGVPLLVVCVARPELYERRPGWGAGQRNTHITNLPPLGDQETETLVGNLLASAVRGHGVEQALLERSGGNPLYAEEFVRLLADRGFEHVTDSDALPQSVQGLIAARLDTLAADRKSLLQDAAVIGKVFWAAAVAEIGGRELADVELALHELARKEFVRPARTTSMEGESEYAFWHLIVRDVAYAQIPRAGRARRHRSAADWIERKAGERVEDLAEVLAHHYIEALELARAAGDARQAAELVPAARRFLALAGERALGLDVAQAESRLARALDLTPADDPGRPVLLARWAEAAYEMGRLREAAAALDEALRAEAPAETTARALQLRSRVAHRLGDRRFVELAAEAVRLLERGAEGQALVDAYAQLAGAQHLYGAYRDAITAAENALALAQRCGLPEPARARGYRGFARAYLGDEAGLEEMEHALALMIAAGLAHEAAFVRNNLAIARYPVQGPQRSLADFEATIAACEERGLAGVAAFLGANCPSLLMELGRSDEAAQRAAALAAGLEGSGNTLDPFELRVSELALRLAQGGHATTEEIESLLASARTLRHAELRGLGLAVAAGALAPTDPGRARLVLAEVERCEGFRETPYYARQLPQVIRTALAAGDVELAERLVAGTRSRYPLEEHARCAARAALAEQRGTLAEAAALYADAALRWKEFGNIPERAHALLGQGRCLLGIRPAEAQPPLREARELFAAMSYGPAVANADALLATMPGVGVEPTLSGS